MKVHNPYSVSYTHLDVYKRQVALQSLNATGRDLQTVQNRVSTGQKVATAKDDGAVWAVANKMKSDVSAYDKVSESTDRALSLIHI